MGNNNEQAFLAEAVSALAVTKRVNELSAEVLSAESALNQASAALSAAESEVARVLRAGLENAVVDRVEENARIAKRAVSRWSAVLDQARAELQRMQTAQKVAVEQLPRQIAMAKAVNAHCEQLILVEYPKLVEPLIKLLGTLAAAEAYLSSEAHSVRSVPYFNRLRTSEVTGWQQNNLSKDVVLPRVKGGTPDLWSKKRHDEFQENFLTHLRDVGLEVGPRATAPAAA